MPSIERPADESAYYHYATSLARQTGRYADLYEAAAAHADRVAPLQDCDCTELCPECRAEAQWNCVAFCGELARLARMHRRSQAAVQDAGSSGTAPGPAQRPARPRHAQSMHEKYGSR